MHCPNCGTSNLDTATICVNCGRPLTASGAPPQPQASYTPPPPRFDTPSAPPVGPQVPNYLVQSILVTLCCCLPLGIVAIIFAAQVNSKLAQGDVAGAMEASKNAKMWCWIAFGLGLVAIVIWMLVGGAAFVQGLREGMAQS